MTVLKLVPHNSPILKEKTPEFDFANPSTDPIQLARDLADTMLHHNGMGLAASQIGLPIRAFTINSHPNIYCMFNPRIVNTSEVTVDLEEGCLSFPGLYIKVTRPKDVKIRFQVPTGDTQTQTFTGITARAILHETDHLNGIIFLNHISRLKRDMAMKKYLKGKK